MIWWLIGIAAGAAIGSMVPIRLPENSAAYVAMAALVTLDAWIGGAARAKADFSSREFVEGWLSTALFAFALTYIGQRLSVQLHLAAATALTIRSLSNLSLLRKEGRLPDRSDGR